MARISLRQAVIEFPIVNASSRSLQLRLYQALGGKLTAHHRTIVEDEQCGPAMLVHETVVVLATRGAVQPPGNNRAVAQGMCTHLVHNGHRNRNPSHCVGAEL